MKKLFLAPTVFLILTVAHGQQSKIDSLTNLVKNAKHDTTRLRLYLDIRYACEDDKDYLKYGGVAVQLADKLLSQTANDKERKKLLKQKAYAYDYFLGFYANKSDTSKLMEYARKQLLIYKEIKDTANIVYAILNFSYNYSDVGNIPKALEYCQKGLLISKEMNYKNGIAKCFGHIGGIYRDQGDTTQALENFQKSLSIYYELKDTNGIANALIAMGNLYGKLHNIAKALEYFHKAMALYQEEKEKSGTPWVYNCIGLMYQNNNDLPNALENFQKSLSIYEEINFQSFVATSLNSIGNIYMEQASAASPDNITYRERLFQKSLDYNFKALKILLKESEENYLIAETYSSLARTYLKQNNYKPAKDYSVRSLAIMKKQLYISAVRDGELLSAQIDSASGNGNGAFEHYKQYIILRDKLNSEEVRKTATREKFQNEYDKQKAVAKAEQDKKDAITEEEKRKQKIITWSVVSGLLLVILFAGFIFRSLRVTRKQKQIIEIKNIETEKQKYIIEEKNKDITDSITYAKRIQQAKLPDRKEIEKAFPNSFVLFKPKDIVSGDFYYFHKNEKNIFIASADCTGHGVPGAFMSMIGSEKLDDALAHSADTSEILSHLNKGIKVSLHQTDSNDSTRDGMDIALCSVDTDTRVVKYAGANRPLWIIRNGQTAVEEIKATKKAIGGFTEDSQHFDTHVVQLQRGDTFYIFSDGYADTFSGADSKKLTTKKFKEILLSIQDKSMQDQELHLDNFVESWKAGTEQVDDILVIGVRM